MLSVMEQRTYYLLTLLLPHRLTLETYRFRDSLWQASGNISTKTLPPCIPLLPMGQAEPIPENIAWNGDSLTVSTDVTISGRALLLPLVPGKPVQELRSRLEKRLERPSYDAEAGELFGIPSMDMDTGIYLSSNDASILRRLQTATETCLSPFDDARLALLRCVPMQEGTLEQGALWEILEQKHLVAESPRN